MKPNIPPDPHAECERELAALLVENARLRNEVDDGLAENARLQSRNATLAQVAETATKYRHQADEARAHVAALVQAGEALRRSEPGSLTAWLALLDAPDLAALISKQDK